MKITKTTRIVIWFPVTPTTRAIICITSASSTSSKPGTQKRSLNIMVGEFRWLLSLNIGVGEMGLIRTRLLIPISIKKGSIVSYTRMSWKLLLSSFMRAKTNIGRNSWKKIWVWLEASKANTRTYSIYPQTFRLWKEMIKFPLAFVSLLTMSAKISQHQLPKIRNWGYLRFLIQTDNGKSDLITSR